MSREALSLKTCGLLIWSCGAAWAAPASAAACDNALSPVQTGWVWTYRVTPGDTKKPASSYALSRAAMGAEFQEQYVSSGKPANTTRSTCAGGAHTSLTPPQLGDIKLTRAVVSGVGVAAAPNWKPGAAWALVWDLEGRQGLLSGKATITARRQVMGREKITVPAGTFDAWKVKGLLRVVGKLGPVPLNRDLGGFGRGRGAGEVAEQLQRHGIADTQEIAPTGTLNENRCRLLSAPFAFWIDRFTARLQPGKRPAFADESRSGCGPRRR